MFIPFITWCITRCTSIGEIEDNWIRIENAIPSEYTFQVEHTALIMVDFQRAFMDPGGFGELLGNNVSLLQHAIEPARNILAVARQFNMTIVHTMESHLDDLSDCPLSKRKINDQWNVGDKQSDKYGRILIRNEYGTGIIDELSPSNNINEKLIYKPGKGAFYKTDLNEYLINNCITHLIFAGITTEVCVQSTMREANDRGYISLLLIDATASYYPKFKQSTIDMITSQNALIGFAVNQTHHVIQAMVNKMYTNTKSMNDKILDRYFEAVKSMNIDNIMNIFDANAEIVTSQSIKKGHKEISEFYLNEILKCKTFVSEANERFYSFNGDISVEIILNCDDTHKKVGDYFAFKDDKIISMRVYSAAGPGYGP